MNLKPYMLGFIGFLVLVVGSALYMVSQQQGKVYPFKHSEFVTKVESGEIKTANVDGQSVVGVLKSNDSYVATIQPSERLFWMMHKQNVEIDVRPEERQQWSFLNVLITMIIFAFLAFLIYTRGGAGGMGGGSSSKLFNIGKSKAKFFEPNAVKITFKDVAGLVEAKEELKDIVDFLRNPEKFKALGAKIPRGVLLNGDPGNGKTLLAKAVAGEANSAFMYMSGSDFVEVFVGVGASKVRDLFAQARKHAPCIVFIDEIDAVGRQRGSNMSAANDEREQTLNQLLAEMDGFSTEAGSVIVLAATNRADVLDKALIRPGRFDRLVMVPYPDIKSRYQILQIHAKNVPLDDSVDLQKVARGAVSMSGAELESLVNEAALCATKEGKKKVEMIHFEHARDKIAMGPERKSMVMSDRLKEVTAVHEAGHTLLNVLLPNTNILHKVTIAPRGSALGITWFFPEADTEMNRSASQLRAEIMVAFGGMIAEKMKYGEAETGVSNDLQKASDVARKMVIHFGMSSLGPISFANVVSRGFGDSARISEQMAARIDAEVEKILTECYAEADRVMRANQDKLAVLSKALLEAETLQADEVYSLLGLTPRESFSFSIKGDEKDADSAREEKAEEVN